MEVAKKSAYCHHCCGVRGLTMNETNQNKTQNCLCTCSSSRPAGSGAESAATARASATNGKVHASCYILVPASKIKCVLWCVHSPSAHFQRQRRRSRTRRLSSACASRAYESGTRGASGAPAAPALTPPLSALAAGPAVRAASVFFLRRRAASGCASSGVPATVCD